VKSNFREKFIVAGRGSTHLCVLATLKAEVRGLQFEASPSQRYPQTLRNRLTAKGLRCCPSGRALKHRALSSVPSTTKKKKTERKN
jgi:hypothetical protein